MIEIFCQEFGDVGGEDLFEVGVLHFTDYLFEVFQLFYFVEFWGFVGIDCLGTPNF